MYRSVLRRLTQKKPLIERGAAEHTEMMKRLRSYKEDQVMDLLWEGLAKTPMPRVVALLLPATVLPQVGVVATLIASDYWSHNFQMALSAGGAVLAGSACAQGALLLGLEALQYHPLQRDKLWLLSGRMRVLLGLTQVVLGCVIAEGTRQEDWRGPFGSFVTQVLAFAFLLTSARHRVVPFWVAKWGVCQLVTSGILSLFMTNSLRHKEGSQPSNDTAHS